MQFAVALLALVWVVILSLWKRVLRVLTGKSELERVLQGESWHSTHMTVSVRSAIKSARQLRPVQEIALASTGGQFDADCLAVMVADAKHLDRLNGSTSMINLRKCMDEMNKLSQIISINNGLRKRAFDHTEPTHQRLLNRLWSAARPGVRLTTVSSGSSSSLISTDWHELGFQGKDPGTDLRAGGLLALHMLRHMAERFPAQTKDLLALQLPRLPNKNYAELPFALTGINVTVLAINLMEKRRLDYRFLVALGQTRGGANQEIVGKEAEKERAIECMAGVVCDLWTWFAEDWKAAAPKSIAEFSGIFSRFSRRAEAKLLGESGDDVLSRVGLLLRS